MSNWRSVKSEMPRNGQECFAFGIDELGNKRVIRAFYAEKNSIEDDDENGGAEYCEEKDEFFLKEGWYESNQYDEINWFVPIEITHWMPLFYPCV